MDENLDPDEIVTAEDMIALLRNVPASSPLYLLQPDRMWQPMKRRHIGKEDATIIFAIPVADLKPK